MKKLIISIILMAICFNYANAQISSNDTRQYYTFGWNIGKLVGSSDAFIPDVSLSGFTFSGQIYISEQFAVGFNVAWNNYYGFVDRKSYELDAGTYVTAEQYRYLTSVPFQVGGFWNFQPDGMIRPYIGLSVGANYSTQSIYVSDYDFYDNQYGFHVSPEIGTFIKFGRNTNWGANLSASYQYNTNSFNFKTIDKQNSLQAINGTIGFTYIIE